jgi:hypothetical protein
MSQKSRDDQHKSAAAGSLLPEAAAVEIVPSATPVAMISATGNGVYVADAGLTKWEKVSELPPNS